MISRDACGSVRAMSSTRLACVVVLLCAAGGVGCFESGPLAAGRDAAADGTGATDGAEDATIVGETEEASVADGVEESRDSGDVSGDGDVSGEVVDTHDATGDAEVSEVKACVGDDDCGDVSAADRCAGPIRCLDYQCVPDPAGAVSCPAATACSRWSCAPETGACVETNTCACDGVAVLQCGVDAIWSSPAGGSGPPLDAFSCGPASTGGAVRLYGMAAHGRVRVSSSGGVRGLHVLSGDVCDGRSCAAGGGDILYFDAVPGVRYTLAVEESGPNTQHAVRADCDLLDEVVCNDGLDDDGDGLTDCAERACDGIAGCRLPPDSELDLCGDRLDNDADGATDCDDGDCHDDAGCLESCEVLTGSIYCNYHQGFDNGSGKARATHYACTDVPQSAREVVFRIDAGFTGRIRIGFSGSNGLSLFLLRETGRGCTPHDCVDMSSGDMFIDLVEGDTFYLAIDGPGDAIGAFDFHIDCLE